MSTTCPYAVLKLPFGADEHEIKRAYAKAIARFRGAVGEAGMPERLDATRWAYRLLTDPEQRQHYDTEQQAKVYASAVASAEVDRHERVNAVTFDGNGKAYFRIWISNLLLTFLSLGIYSAWAKVRREQYFHRRLRIAGAAFDYHGSPTSILKGRLLLALMLALYALTRFMPPMLHALVVLGTVFVFPWMIVRSLQFRAANTSYRGLRFAFRGSYREALGVYLGYGLLTLLSLGLALPLWLWRQKKFLITHLGYGSNVFGYYASPRMFYRALWLPTLLVFLPVGGVLLALLLFGKSFVLVIAMLVAAKAVVPLVFAVLLILQLVVFPYVRMKSLNVAWSNSRLFDASLQCDLRFVTYGATHASNWLLVVLSFGLFWPWAAVRTMRYRARHFFIRSAGSLDEFRAGPRQSASALGGEAVASMGMDVGL